MEKNNRSNILAFLRQPYPLHPNRWMALVLVPLFISLFMVTFQPFGLQSSTVENKNLLLVGYGLVTLIMLAANMYLLPLIFPRRFREKSWSVASEILHMTWIVLTISVGNYAYSVLFDIVRWAGVQGLIIFIGFTFSIAIIPIVLLTIISHNQFLRKHLEGADEIRSMLPGSTDRKETAGTIALSSESGKQHVETSPRQLIAVESDGNYVLVHHVREGKIIKTSLRNTIKNLDLQLKDSDGFFRCHRAFIINLRYVTNVEGNSQGYKVTLRYLDSPVPVARNFTRAFRREFKARNQASAS